MTPMSIKMDTLEVVPTQDIPYSVEPINIRARIQAVDELRNSLQARLNYNERLQKRRNWISRGRTSRKR